MARVGKQVRLLKRNSVVLLGIGLGGLFAPDALFGQWTAVTGGINYSGGNVGIHMTAPVVPLQIGVNMQATYFGDGSNSFVFSSFNGRSYFGYDSTSNDAVVQGTAGKGIEFNVNNSSFAQGTAMTLTSAGNLGIGTTNPMASLEVDSPGPGGLTTLLLKNPSNTWGSASAYNSYRFISTASVATDGLFKAFNVGGGGASIGYSNTPVYGSSDALYVNGNVGIGTTTPAHLLHVAGTIGAEEVIVSATGADYVFQPDYHRLSLNQIGAYIRANRHLPGIPSATEMKDKGVAVGEMQSKLLAKVEELTLQMIQMNEENNKLKERVARLENR